MINYKIENTNTTNSTGDILYIKDSSTGYGGVNPTRDSLALFLLSTYISTKNEIVAEVRSYDPLVVDTFTAKVGRDGWYKFSLVSLELYDDSSLSSYEVGDIYYDSVFGRVVKVVSTLNLVNDIVVINPIDIPTSYVVAITDAFVVYGASKTKIAINGFISDLLTNNVDFSDKRLRRLKDNYNTVRAILQGAVYEFCRGNKYVAQKSIEFLNENDYVSV